MKRLHTFVLCLITMVGLSAVTDAMQAQTKTEVPQKVETPVKVRQSAEWYKTQERLWKAEIDKINEKISLAKNRFEIIEQFKDVKELDYLTAQTLIDYVEIGGNQYNRIINIYWNF